MPRNGRDQVRVSGELRNLEYSSSVATVRRRPLLLYAPDCCYTFSDKDAWQDCRLPGGIGAEIVFLKPVPDDQKKKQ